MRLPTPAASLCGSLHYLILMGSAATSQFIKHSPCVNTGYLSGGVALSSPGSCRNRTERILWTNTWMADLSVRIYAPTLSWSVLMPNQPLEGGAPHLVTFISLLSARAGESCSCAEGFSKPSWMDMRLGSVRTIRFHRPPGGTTSSTRPKPRRQPFKNLPVLTGLLTPDIIR